MMGAGLPGAGNPLEASCRVPMTYKVAPRHTASETSVLHNQHMKAVAYLLHFVRDQGGHCPFFPAFAAFDFFFASSLNSIFFTCSGTKGGKRVDAWFALSSLVRELCSVCGAAFTWISSVAAPLSALIRMKKEAKSSGVDRTTWYMRAMYLYAVGKDDTQADLQHM